MGTADCVNGFSAASRASFCRQAPFAACCPIDLRVMSDCGYPPTVGWPPRLRASQRQDLPCACRHRRAAGSEPPPGYAPRLRGRFNGHDLQGMGFTLMTADWNILAGCEGVHAEAVSGLVVVRRVRVVVEHPSRVLHPARLVGESPHFFVCAVPKPAHPAMLPVLLPKMRVDMPFAVERCHEFVAVAGGANWKLLGSSKFEPNAFQHMGQRHGRTPLRSGRRQPLPYRDCQI